jgi:hypothetical protein
MERTVAVKRLAKLLGKDMGYRVYSDAPSAEERARLKAESPALLAAREEAKKAKEERCRAILDADQEYQRLCAVHTEAAKAMARASSQLHSYKITVGIASNVGAFSLFRVAAQGDSWEQVIEKLEK